MFYRKRKKDEYLKYNNGKIESLGEKSSIPKDYIETSYEKELNDGYSEVSDINEYKNSLKETENKSNNEENNPKDKFNKSSILIKLGVFIILIPLLMITFKTFVNYKNNLNETISKEEVKTSEEVKSVDENQNIDTKNENVEIETTISDNKELKLSNLLKQINTININLNKSYDSTKTDILNFKNDINGTNATRENLLARKNRVLKNKQKIEEIESQFAEFDLLEVHKKILRSYDSLYTGIDQILLDISKDRVVRILNNSIMDRNELLEQQNAIIKQYLNDNNIRFIENNGEFEIIE